MLSCLSTLYRPETNWIKRIQSACLWPDECSPHPTRTAAATAAEVNVAGRLDDGPRAFRTPPTGHARTRTHSHARIHTPPHVRPHTHTHTHTYTHTHTHTHLH